MRKRVPNKTALFISLGCMFMSQAFLLGHVMKLPDFVMGGFMGFGIGLMITFFIWAKMKPRCQK